MNRNLNYLICRAMNNTSSNSLEVPEYVDILKQAIEGIILPSVALFGLFGMFSVQYYVGVALFKVCQYLQSIRINNNKQ